MFSTKKNVLTRFFTAAAPLLWLYAAVQAGCSGSSSNDNPPPPPPTKTTYTGTLYMASEAGGHVVAFPVTIDPSNATAPITVDFTSANFRTIQLKTAAGTQAGFGTNNTTHIFHDVRLDGTKLYYSAIFADSTPGSADLGRVHIGYVDLANADAVHDATIDTTTVNATGMAYCGSGQSTTHFFPMSMSSPAYIDAIAKSAITTGAALNSTGANVKRTTVESFRTGGDPNYLFAHGVNSRDGSKIYVAVNEISSGAMTGAVTAYLMNTTDVVAGTVTAANVTKSTVGPYGAGGPGVGTVAFRSTFNSDGRILQAGSDRLIVLNANLTESFNDTNIGGSFKANGGMENHDVMPTPDGKYAILALRFKPTSTSPQNSAIQLYDLTNKHTIGDPVSPCAHCHPLASNTKPRLTCGIDGALTTHTQ